MLVHTPVPDDAEEALFVIIDDVDAPFGTDQSAGPVILLRRLKQDIISRYYFDVCGFFFCLSCLDSYNFAVSLHVDELLVALPPRRR